MFLCFPTSLHIQTQMKRLKYRLRHFKITDNLQKRYWCLKVLMNFDFPSMFSYCSVSLSLCLSISIFCAVIICWQLCTRVKGSFEQLCSTRKRPTWYIRARWALERWNTMFSGIFSCLKLIILMEWFCFTHEGWWGAWQYKGKLRVPEESHSAGCGPSKGHQPYLQ